MTTDLLAQGRWGEDRESNLLDGGAPYYRVYRCRDGGYISVGALERKFYDLLCDLIGMAVDDRGREEAEWPELHERFEALFATRTRSEWTRLLQGTDACFAPVLTLSEAAHYPHMAARAVYASVDGVVQPSPAPRFSVTQTRLRGVDAVVRHISEAGVWD